MLRAAPDDLHLSVQLKQEEEEAQEQSKSYLEAILLHHNYQIKLCDIVLVIVCAGIYLCVGKMPVLTRDMKPVL